VAFRIFLWAVGGRSFPEGVLAAQKGVPNIPREELEKAFLERMERQYGPSVGCSQIDLNLSYWLAFHDWGRMLKESVWARRRDLQRDFWMRYIDSPARMAEFTVFVLERFLSVGQHLGPGVSLEAVLSRDDIRELALRYPPYQDEIAVSYLRELLGKDVIPEPIRVPGNQLPGRG
jgi:hypothetical protein